MEEHNNGFFDIGLLPDLGQERIDEIFSSEKIRIERIISHGSILKPSDWYEQAEDEWVLLLQGSARIEFEAVIKNLRAGDYLFIPSKMRHRLVETSSTPDCIWLCLFGDFKGIEKK